jgi:Flp pilus assembly protein TadG
MSAAAKRPPDAGISTVEVVILTPLLMFMVLLIVCLGVLVNAHGRVNAAARDAARAGTFQQTAAEALQQARLAAAADLGNQCDGKLSDVTAAYQAPKTPGGVGYYKATVTCVVNLTGFGVVGAKQTITASFSAPVDPMQNTDLAGP